MEYLRPARLCRVQRSMPVVRSHWHHLPAPSAGTIYRHHLAARIDRHRALERSGSEGRASCRIMDHKTVRGTAAPI